MEFSRLEALTKDVFNIVLFYIDMCNGLTLKRASKGFVKKVDKSYNSSAFWNACLVRIGKKTVSDNPRGLYEFYCTVRSELVIDVGSIIEKNPIHCIAYVKTLTKSDKLEIIENYHYVENNSVDDGCRHTNVLDLIIRSYLRRFDPEENDNWEVFKFIVEKIVYNKKRYESDYQALKPLFDRYPAEVCSLSTVMRREMKKPGQKGKIDCTFPEMYLRKRFYKLLKPPTHETFEKFTNEERWNIVTNISRYDKVFKEHPELLIRKVTPETLNLYRNWLETDKNRLQKSYEVYCYSFRIKVQILRKSIRCTFKTIHILRDFQTSISIS